MPKPPSMEPVSEMLSIINRFSTELADYTNGNKGHEGLVQDLKNVYEAFRSKIWSAAPRFSPFTRKEITEQSEAGNLQDSECTEGFPDSTESMPVKSEMPSLTATLSDVTEHIAK